jgi:hypothetical protein
MPERQCDGCKRQDEWGCHAKPYTVVNDQGVEEVRWHRPAQLPITLLGEETWACPRQPIRENPFFWSKVLKFYGLYKKGFLPDQGAIVDQSNKLIELFRIIDDANDQCDQEELNREKQRQNRESRMPARRR